MDDPFHYSSHPVRQGFGEDFIISTEERYRAPVFNVLQIALLRKKGDNSSTASKLEQTRGQTVIIDIQQVFRYDVPLLKLLLHYAFLNFYFLPPPAPLFSFPVLHTPDSSFIRNSLLMNRGTFDTTLVKTDHSLKSYSQQVFELAQLSNRTTAPLILAADFMDPCSITSPNSQTNFLHAALRAGTHFDAISPRQRGENTRTHHHSI
ncbi:hypothetical protein XENOCAPTIV_030579 [Xenoophorus captivus]|uniref:Uncharacterized protein n=1 Tax=Xenoophorus captivus TaxID=1517983 RepID=A0ABV0S409_9TELE